jgi:hypothetical protein
MTRYNAIKRDGELVIVLPENEVMEWFHKTHSFSLAHALKHEGYTIDNCYTPNQLDTLTLSRLQEYELDTRHCKWIMGMVRDIDPDPRQATLLVFLEMNAPQLVPFLEKIWDQSCTPS